MKDITKSGDAEEVRQKVRAGYSDIAQHGSERRGSGKSCCCGGGSPIDTDKLAQTVGYSADELAALPEGANMGLSCGNPNALASLKPGEVVLDLGSGGGFDVFIAGKKVGPTGRAIGVDMTAEMLAKARKNTQNYRETTGLDNVEFRLGEIEHLPLADNSVDVVISNCVINLSPDKQQVWREIARVLKPGGRVAVSDLALLKPLPRAVAEMVEALVGCVAGAVLTSETERIAREAGLSDIVLNPKHGYVDAMMDWQDPLYQKILENLPSGTKPGEFITSLEVTAKKLGACCSRPTPLPGAAVQENNFSPAVRELVAIGAAIAANCEPCFKHHYNEARKLGVSTADMAQAVEMAAKVKDSPHQAILHVADRFTGSGLSRSNAEPDVCCGAQAQTEKCCGN